MLLSYSVGTGTCFRNVDSCIISNPQPFEISDYISIGIDPAFSSDGSKFAVTAVTVNPANGKIRILFSQQWGGLSNSQSVSVVRGVLDKLGFRYENRSQFRCFIDSAASGFYTDIKPLFFESPDWAQINRFKETAIRNNIQIWQVMLVCGISFSSDGLSMLQKIQSLISDGMLEIPSNMSDLILQLRISQVKSDGNLEKKIASDLVDSLRLSCFMVQKRY